MMANQPLGAKQLDEAGMVERNELGAIILCGGHSRRMGQPKAMLPFGPQEVLLQRVVRLIGEVVDAVVVVAAAGQGLPDLPDRVRITRDEIEDRGPLQGLAAGLAALPDRTELVYLSATDCPIFEAGWIKVLTSKIGLHDAAIPQISDRIHPLSGLYRRASVAPKVAAMLAPDRLRMMDLLDTLDCVYLADEAFREVDPELRTVWNLNTRNDYTRALELLALDFK